MNKLKPPWAKVILVARWRRVAATRDLPNIAFSGPACCLNQKCYLCSDCTWQTANGER